jgi:hypothetical protein
MQTITFTPKTNRERQIIRDFGKVWHVVREMNAPCFNGDLGLFIVSQCGDHARWIKKDQAA